jgi:hypothetical protein
MNGRGRRKEHGKRKQSLQKKTQHHVIPQSRIAGKMLNHLVADDQMIKYRKLFGSKNPFEVLVFLVEKFWGRRWFFLVNALVKRTFERGVLECDEIILVPVDKRDHEKFHEIFVNMTPRESVLWLVVYYWDGKWEPVARAIEYYAQKIK